MKWRSVIVPAGMVAGLLLAAGLSRIPAVELPAAAAIPASQDQLSVCATGYEPATVYAGGGAPIGFLSLAKGATQTTAQSVTKDQADPSVLTSTMRFAAGALVVDGETAGWANCAAAATTGQVQLLDPSLSDVVLVNPDSTPATADFTFYGKNGELSAVGAAGITVAPKSSTILPVSVLLEGKDPVAVSMDVTSGRLSVAGRSWGGKRGDFSALTAPATDILLPGVFANAKQVTVLATNSGEQRATVSVSALANTELALQGAQGVTVEPGTTVAIEIEGALEGDAAALRVTSDQPVTATGYVATAKDLAVTSAAEPFKLGKLISPAGGILSVTNPTKAPVSVQVAVSSDSSGAQPTSQAIEIAAGATWTSQGPKAGTVTYDITSPTPVVAAVSHSDEKAAYVAPLVSMTELEANEVKLVYRPTLR